MLYLLIFLCGCHLSTEWSKYSSGVQMVVFTFLE